jgi:hypothetical protein
MPSTLLRRAGIVVSNFPTHCHVLVVGNQHMRSCRNLGPMAHTAWFLFRLVSSANKWGRGGMDAYRGMSFGFIMESAMMTRSSHTCGNVWDPGDQRMNPQ